MTMKEVAQRPKKIAKIKEENKVFKKAMAIFTKKIDEIINNNKEIPEVKKNMFYLT